MKKTTTSNKGPAAKIALLEGLARFIIDEARRLGASDADVSIANSESVDTTVRLGVVEQLQGAQRRGVTLRVFVGKRSASASSSDLRRASLRKLVKSTIALARASEEDPFAGLPETHQLASAEVVARGLGLGLYDPAIPALPVEKKIDMALACESAARNADPRITNSEGASFSDGGGIQVYANSRGFIGSSVGNYCSLNTQVVASDAESGEMQVNGWHSASRSLAGLESPESIGKKAAARALRQLGARKVKSQVVPVVFDPQMAARLLGQFVGAASGAAIYRNSSFLVGKLGEVVASPAVTIIDDPLMPGRLGSKAFDGEGLPLQTRTIVDAGKLITYLVGSYAGRKLGCEPNSGSTGNLYLQAGTRSPEEIIASVSNGLYLTGVSGPGFNAVTGDYSLGASGLWIEDGKLAFPVAGITIASNVLDMFAGILEVGNDLEFRSGVSSPTILIDKMTVGGE